ncbi:hypothetical protein PR003_g8002 [Phytophthora rubi]|nr:hypothetical protein PR003_g8002 [Phytophthora rubi]
MFEEIERRGNTRSCAADLPFLHGRVDAVPHFGHRGALKGILYLPMVRVLERVVLALMFLDGASVGFYPGDLRLLMNDTAALQPTVLVTVPRLVSGVYDTQGVDAVGGIQKLVFDQVIASKLAGVE